MKVNGNNMNIVISPEYEHLQGYLETIPDLMANDVADKLYDGRNKIVRFTSLCGTDLVVKQYKRHNWLKCIIYTFFRPSKARRSYNNAIELRKRGFATPREIAFIEKRHLGFIVQTYYICSYTSAKAIRSQLIDKQPFNLSLAEEYAKYVVSLHEAGVLHCDLNPTNVLYSTRETGGYCFELIDINRMRFYNKSLSKVDSMKNLTLFWWLSDIYRYILDVYAATRGWQESDIAKAVEIKQKHDACWVRRKKITGLLKHYILRK